MLWVKPHCKIWKLSTKITLLEYFLLRNRFPLCACTCVHVCVCLIALNPVPQTSRQLRMI